VRDREVYAKEIADALEADLQPLATSGLITRKSKYDTNPANIPDQPNDYSITRCIAGCLRFYALSQCRALIGSVAALTQTVRALKQATTEIPIVTVASEPLRSGRAPLTSSLLRLTGLAEPVSEERNLRAGVAPIGVSRVAHAVADHSIAGSTRATTKPRRWVVELSSACFRRNPSPRQRLRSSIHPRRGTWILIASVRLLSRRYAKQAISGPALGRLVTTDCG
jgi:hypothetical protein